MKTNALLIPNSDIPFTASNAAIICQRSGNATAEVPRVGIVATEKSNASVNDPIAPTRAYAAAQSAASNEAGRHSDSENHVLLY